MSAYTPNLNNAKRALVLRKPKKKVSQDKELSARVEAMKGKC